MMQVLTIFVPYCRRRSPSKGEFHMLWPWLRSLMSTPMTGFTSAKEQFSQSTVFPLDCSNLTILMSFIMCCFLAVQLFNLLCFGKKNRPSYRKRKSSNSTEFSVRTNASVKGTGPSEAPAMLVPNLAPARSVREAIQEVKMVQVCSFHVIPFPSLSTVCMKNFQTHPCFALSP